MSAFSIASRYSVCVTRRQHHPGADRPILPLLWLLSDRRNDAGIETALRSLPSGSGFVFRHYHLDPDTRRARFDELAAIAHQCGHTVVLSGDDDWGADGHYGSATRPRDGLFLATAHNEDELAAAGVNIVIYANQLLRSAYPAMVQVAKSILSHGRAAEAEERCMPIKDIISLIPERTQA